MTKLEECSFAAAFNCVLKARRLTSILSNYTELSVELGIVLDGFILNEFILNEFVLGEYIPE